MKTLDELVKETVEEFVKTGTLFTALDVSNKVKNIMPLSRHRDVRDVVRNLFVTDIETAGYTKTPIKVTLKDQSTAEAVLYHPLIDSWDLDNKYSAQQRAAVVSSGSSSQSVVPVKVAATPTPSVPVAPPAPPPTARVLWNQLFGSQPSLFPRK